MVYFEHPFSTGMHITDEALSQNLTEDPPPPTHTTNSWTALKYTRVVPESRITRKRYGLLQSNFVCDFFHFFLLYHANC